MTQSEQIQEMITQGSQILSKCKVSKNMQNYFTYQLLGIQSRSIFFPCCNRYSQLKQQIGEQFQRAYHSLAKKQRAQFYLLNAKSVQKCQSTQNLKKESIIDQMLNNKQFDKLRFSIRDNRVFKKKTQVNASIDKKQKQIKIDIYNQIIDLHKFLIRKSKNKNHKYCIVLEAIQPFISSSTIHLCFNEFDYKKSYPIIKKLWEDSQCQNIQVVVKKQTNKETKRIDPKIQTMNSIIINAQDGQIGQLHQQIRQLSKKNIIRSGSIDSRQFENSQLEQIDDSLQFFTVQGSLQSHCSVKVIQQLNGQNDFAVLKDQLTERQTKLQHRYLRHRYQLTPKNKGEPKLFKQPQGHIVFGKDWRVCDNGYLVFINKQKLKAQSSVFKSVVKQIGANIMSGKGLSNILNISFPVQVFGNYSNLQKMAKAYIYAPKFIEKAVKASDPVQRMKNIICFSLGTTVAYVQSEKPFNPILGQTYQGLIDGCPLYAEQISHHPPICSVLFLGRGYKIYGTFQPKFQIGLNTATGRNDGVHNIEFQSDHNIIKCYNPAGQMQGLAIGQRRLFQTRKTAYIDSKNRIYCQIVWGRQTSDPYPQAKLYDYFRGRIVKIKQGVNMSDSKNIKKNHIQEQFGDVYGRFTGKMYYNNQLLFDTGSDLPFELQDYVPCLQSDSRYRKDIIQMRKNDLEAAQRGKEELEQIQRNDRKLRKSFQKLY